TSIFGTAPHKKRSVPTPDLLPSRSWHTVGDDADGFAGQVEQFVETDFARVTLAVVVVRDGQVDFLLAGCFFWRFARSQRYAGHR
ncbi:hypothetical protein, partial [Amycolatopsis japonica]